MTPEDLTPAAGALTEPPRRLRYSEMNLEDVPLAIKLEVMMHNVFRAAARRRRRRYDLEHPQDVARFDMSGRPKDEPPERKELLPNRRHQTLLARAARRRKVAL